MYPKNATLLSVVAVAFAFILIDSLSSPVFASTGEMYYSMGQRYAAEGNFDMAILALEKAVELSPDWPEAHNALGEAYTRLLRFQDAVSEFDKALALRKDYAQAEINRRRAMMSIERYEPMKGSRLKGWHKFAILGGITAAIALVSALVVHNIS